jgi:uncharacterized protein YndB with AHSA1/START domain
MDILTTQVFRFATAADPDRIWAALTSPEQTSRCWGDLSLYSDWAVGSSLWLYTPETPILFGEVIAAAPPARLVYALHGGCGPATYVTWEITPSSEGRISIVRLSVDEFNVDDPDEAGDSEDDDSEVAWLTFLADLQRVLDADDRRADEGRDQRPSDQGTGAE